MEIALDQHLALGHAHHRSAQLLDHLHVVLDEDEGVAALAVEDEDLLLELAQQGAVDTGGGLVEQHQFGVGHHRAAELEQFLLPAGQVARALVGDVSQFQEGERVVGLLAHRLFGRAHLAGGEPVGEEVLAGLPRRHHHQILARGEVVELVGDLEGAYQAFVEARVGRQRGDVLAEEADGARGRLQGAGDQVEQRGLARAVGADEAEDLALGHPQGAAIHGMEAAEGFDQAIHFEHSVAIPCGEKSATEAA